MIGKILLAVAAAHAINTGPDSLLMLMPARGAIGHAIATALPTPEEVGNAVKEATRKAQIQNQLPPLPPPVKLEPPDDRPRIRIHG